MGSIGVDRETGRARVSSRSLRKTLGEILGCCPNKVQLSGPKRGNITMVVDRGVARHVQDRKLAIEYRGTIPELIAHAISLTTPPEMG